MRSTLLLPFLCCLTWSDAWSAVNWDSGGGSLPNVRPTSSAGGSYGSSSSSGSNSSGGGGGGPLFQPGKWAQNANDAAPGTISEQVTEYADDPAKLYYRSGIHAYNQGDYALAVDQFTKARQRSGEAGAPASNQGTIDRNLKYAQEQLDNAKRKAASAQPTPEQIKARAGAKAAVTSAIAEDAKAYAQYQAKAWDTAYATYQGALAHMDEALRLMPGNADLLARRTDISHRMAFAAYQQGLKLHQGLPEPGVTMRDGSPLIKPHPVEALAWFKKGTDAWPEQPALKERHEWQSRNTVVGAAP